MLGLLFLFEHLSTQGSPENEVRAALARKIERNTLDGRSDLVDAELIGMSRVELELLIDEAKNLRGMFAAGDGKWIDTLVHVDDYAFVAEPRLACAARYAQDIDVCFYRLAMVIAPSEAGRGEIVHARADLVDPADGPDPTAQNHRQCAQYIDCLGEIRIGQTIPVPRDMTAPFALEELFQSSQVRPELLRADKVRQMLPLFDGEVAFLDAKENRSLHQERKLRSTRATARYMRRHLRKLEDLENGTFD